MTKIFQNSSSYPVLIFKQQGSASNTNDTSAYGGSANNTSSVTKVFLEQIAEPLYNSSTMSLLGKPP